MWFAKYQGLGNDFIVLDRARCDVVLTPERTRALCDRRFGIGADGVLEVRASTTSIAEMVVHNADGSRAEMCGNGLRCVARYLAQRDPELPGTYTLQTGAGPLTVQHIGNDVSVQMGAVSDHGYRDVEIENRLLRGHFVSLGNPHFVLYGDWTRDDALRLGPIIERHTAFPDGVNVSFATQLENGIRLFVWERGCGLTLACGTGACATVAVGWLDGLLSTAQTTEVNLPGGPLQISGRPDSIFMRGPAEHVFDGEWTTPWP